MEKQSSRRKAIALSYTPDMEAPKVVASGEGLVADKILELAEKNSIPVYEDKKVATLLQSTSVGEQIPPELYELIAKILVFVGDIDETYAKFHKEGTK